jgi:hypothetical protein
MATTPNPHSAPFPVGNGNTLDFELLAQFKPTLLQSFSLDGCQILRLDGSPHWALLIHFIRHGVHYGLIAAKPSPPRNNSFAHPPSRDRSIVFSELLQTMQVSDRVTRYIPPDNTPWSDPPLGYQRVYALELPSSHNLTLLHVSLVLRCTHNYQATHRFVGHNCQWMAKTVALALEQLAHQHSSLERWKPQERIFFERTYFMDMVRKKHVRKALCRIIPAYHAEVS